MVGQSKKIFKRAILLAIVANSLTCSTVVVIWTYCTILPCFFDFLALEGETIKHCSFAKLLLVELLNNFLLWLLIKCLLYKLTTMFYAGGVLFEVNPGYTSQFIASQFLHTLLSISLCWIESCSQNDCVVVADTSFIDKVTFVSLNLPFKLTTYYYLPIFIYKIFFCLNLIAFIYTVPNCKVSVNYR